MEEMGLKEKDIKAQLSRTIRERLEGSIKSCSKKGLGKGVGGTIEWRSYSWTVVLFIRTIAQVNIS